MSAQHVARNSAGEPWQKGQVWHCDRCGQSGPDRDDVNLPGCTAGPYSSDRQPHTLRFAPLAHARAIVAAVKRRGREYEERRAREHAERSAREEPT